MRLTSSLYHPETNRADVTFTVQPGPIVSIRVTGAKLSKKALKRLMPIYQENSVDPELVAEGERNIVNYFQSKSLCGYRLLLSASYAVSFSVLPCSSQVSKLHSRSSPACRRTVGPHR